MKNQNTASECNPIPADVTRPPSIDISISPADGKRIARLLQRHFAIREDDTTDRAAIRLASMALTLANIASGHLCVLSDGIEHDLAVDFIVEGGITAADFTNSVIGSVGRLQGRYERCTLHDVTLPPADKGKDSDLHALQRLQHQNEMELLPVPAARRVFVVGHNEYRQAMKESQSQAQSQGSRPLYTAEQAKEICKIYLPHRLIGKLFVSKRQETMLREALEYPLFFVRVATPAGLYGQTSRAHLGRQMVYAEMDSAATLEAMRKEVADIGARKGSGVAKGSPAVRVNLCLSAVTGILDEVVATGVYQQKSIPNLLWLVETAAGCDLPEIREAAPIDDRPNFREACRAEISRRISFRDEDSYHLQSLDGHLAEWWMFLNEQERNLPGIAQVVHNLPVALGYGLGVLHFRKTEIDGREVVAWAKWLVLRMSNRVAAARATGRDSNAERLATKLAEKLVAEGPMKVRDLSRRISKLKSDDCRKALNLLAEQGIAGEQDGVWGILLNPGAFAQKVAERKVG